MRIPVQKQHIYRETAESMPPRPLHPHWWTGRDYRAVWKKAAACFSEARREAEGSIYTRLSKALPQRAVVHHSHDMASFLSL